MDRQAFWVDVLINIVKDNLSDSNRAGNIALGLYLKRENNRRNRRFGTKMPKLILSQVVYSKIYVMLLYWDRKNTRKG